MAHECSPACECRMDLDAATAALEISSRLLSAFVLTESTDLIEKYYGAVRASEVKLRGAMAAYRDHLTEA
jgi:hypothetical protein